jgi:hypothetical protein
VRIDHLVVAARSLDEGSEWIERTLGVRPVAGGKHDTMGTHNRLLRLGPMEYLEVIAVDPQAPRPLRPRWFALDSAAMHARLATRPALIHWVVRTDDIERDARECPEELEILALSRGEYRWRIAVPPDGRLPCGGQRATLIQWDGPAHPARDLPDVGCRLVALDTSGASPSARIASPRGETTLE